MDIVKFYIKSFEGINKDVWLIALIYFINRCGEMVIPFMGLYITDVLGWTPVQAGWILTSFGVGALVGSKYGGYFSDELGVFTVMKISLFGTAFCFPMIVMFHNFWALAFWMFITAVFSSAFSPAAFSGVTFFSKEENVTRGYSLLRLAINLGISVGPAIGGFLAFSIGYQWIFVGDGLTCLLAGIALIYLFKGRSITQKPKKIESKVKAQSPYKDFALVLFLLFNLINMIAFFQILFTIPQYFKEVLLLNEFWIGLFLSINGIAVFTLEMPIVFMIEKSKKFLKPMVWGAIMIGIGFLFLAVFDNPIIAVVGYGVLIVFGEIINFPLIPTLALRRANENNKGDYMGAVSMMFALAMALGPICGFKVVDLIGYDYYWYVLGTMSIISGLSLLLLKKSFMPMEK